MAAWPAVDGTDPDQDLVDGRWPRRRPEGFAAVEPLGIAVLALNVGMPVEVSSEYLPENLLRGVRPAG
jgi:immunity protein 49 of polymorphic toxin system